MLQHCSSALTLLHPMSHRVKIFVYSFLFDTQINIGWEYLYHKTCTYYYLPLFGRDKGTVFKITESMYKNIRVPEPLRGTV